MASFQISLNQSTDGNWAITNYNAVYDDVTNTTTVTFDSMNCRTFSKYHTTATVSITLTVTATDSNDKATTTAYTEDYRNGDDGHGVTYPTPSPKTVTVKHSNTSGKKSVTITCSTYTTWNNGANARDSSGSTTVTSSKSFEVYKLSTIADIGSTITVNRTSSAAQGDTGNLLNGSDIYKNDALQITFDASPGYAIKTNTVNGSTFASGDTHTVSGDVDILTTTELYGLMHVYNGSSWDPYLVYVYNGSSWDQYIPYVYNGSSWDICS